MSQKLQKAIAKCSRFSNTRQFVGYLTPVDIVTLVDVGHVSPSSGCETLVEHARRDIRSGLSTCKWFYFYPNGLKMIDRR